MNKILILGLILLLASCANSTYCEPEQRNADLCIALYEPVCGDNEQTYSNSCNACKDENVKYWVEGECR